MDAGSMNGLVMNGHDDHRLVLLSMPIASMVSYTALDLAGRVMESPGRFRVLWLGGGALAIGFVQKPERSSRPRRGAEVARHPGESSERTCGSAFEFAWLTL